MKKALPLLTLLAYIVALAICIVNIVIGAEANIAAIIIFSLYAAGMLVMIFFTTKMLIEKKLSEIKNKENDVPFEGLAVVEEPVEAESDDIEQSVSDLFADEKEIAVAGFGKSRYIYSFLARLIQSEDDIKGYYSMIKNAFMSYKKVSSSISREHERFRFGRSTIGIMKIRGKTLLLYLALDPKQFDGTMYVGEDVSNITKYADTPFLYRVNGPRKATRAVRLIEMLAAQMQLTSIEPAVNVDYVASYPYESTNALIKKGLIIDTEADTVVEALTPPAEETTEAVIDTAGFGVARYIFSFTARLIQSAEELKNYYSMVKNAFMSYQKVSSSISREHERIRFGRSTLAIMKIRGKTLLLYLALDPKQFDGTMYVGEDVSDTTKYSATPFLYRVNGPRKALRAVRLIDMMAEQMQLTPAEIPANVDYAALFPYESTNALVKKGLVIDTGAKESAPVEIKEAVEVETVEDISTKFGKARYTRTYTAKLIQSEDELKGYYSVIKNAFASYKKVSSTVSSEQERIRFGRSTLAIMKIRGKTILLYLALDPKQFDGTMYVGEDVSKTTKYAATPFLYRVNGPRKATRAARLIAMIAEKLGIASAETPANEDYVALLPYESTKALIKKGLIIDNIAEAERKAKEAKLAAEEAELAAQKAIEEAIKAKEHASNVSERSERTIDEIEAAEEAKATKQ